MVDTDIVRDEPGPRIAVPAGPNALAWKELRAMLERFVARRVASTEVEDVLHEVFVRIARALPSLRQSERLSAWVYQIARNAIADHYRRPKAPAVSLVESDGPLDTNDEESLAATDLARDLRELVGLLPAKYRKALELTDLDGITQAAAARRLGLSVPGMKSRVQRARARLRELLETCCDIELDVRGRVVDCEPRRRPAQLPNCCSR